MVLRGDIMLERPPLGVPPPPPATSGRGGGLYSESLLQRWRFRLPFIRSWLDEDAAAAEDEEDEEERAGREEAVHV